MADQYPSEGHPGGTMKTIAVFRSCLRKEYRDQVIKMLRAVPGEYTRTSYRFQWIGEEVLPLIESGEPLRFVSFIVNPKLTQAVPVRSMTLVEPPVRDMQIGVYRFTFELGPYVATPGGYDPLLSNWSDEGRATPPDIFVSSLGPQWDELEELGYGQSLQTWKDSISFLAEHWSDFANTVFFRPHGDAYEGSPNGPVRTAQQSEPGSFRFFAFNPHLTDGQLAQKSLHVSIGDVIGDMGEVPLLPRDGTFDVDLTFLEPGTANVQVEVRPDEQFSAYVPLRVEVGHNAEVDPSGPRILGPEWTRFLENSARSADRSPEEVLDLFTQLASVFPGDPELNIQTGLIHFRQGRFGAARDEFAKSLTVRQDPRAVWWSFLSALRSNDQRDAETLIVRLDLSRLDLFEAAVETMTLLDDATVQWFAELPGLALGEDKATRLLLAMLAVPRSEDATVATVRALGDLNPVTALQRARVALETNPDWYSLRQAAVFIAKARNLFEFVEDDVEILIDYAGEPVDDYLGTVASLRPLLHPHRLPGLLMSNAIRLGSRGEPDAMRAALVLAMMSAEQAAANGDFVSAQNAIQFVEMNSQETEQRANPYREQIAQIVGRMTRAIESTPGLSRLEDVYLTEMAADLRTDYEGTEIVIFGGKGRAPEMIDQWARELGVSSLRWICWEGSTPPDPNKLRETVNEKTTLVTMTLDEALITESIRRWLRTNRARVIRAMDTKASIYGALRALAPSAESAVIFVPQSCSDALAWALVNCPYLELSPGADDDIDELDQMQNWSHVAQRIKADLELLNRYAEEQSAGRVKVGFYNWAQFHGYSSSLVALRESETTDNNKKFRQERTFPVPRIADPTGEIYMPAHMKLPGNYPTKPRIHFSLDTLPTTGKIFIGYIGPHLTTHGTN